jgi:hypothetical protein
MSPPRNWDSPNPYLASECVPPPKTKGGGGQTGPAGEGLGESKIPTTEEKLSTLPTLWLGMSERLSCKIIDTTLRVEVTT